MKLSHFLAVVVITTYGTVPILANVNYFAWMYDRDGHCRMSPDTASGILTIRDACQDYAEDQGLNMTDPEFRSCIMDGMGGLDSDGMVNVDLWAYFLVDELTTDVVEPIVEVDGATQAELLTDIYTCFTDARMTNYALHEIFGCAINKCLPFYNNDVDECAKNKDNCDVNATCTNTIGSFTCECNDGYSGDGVTCTAD